MNSDPRPDWWALRLDETHSWRIDPKDRPFIECIVGVYIFDRNSHTCCCELTPSYWLIHLNDDIYFNESAFDGMTEHAAEERRDEIRSRCFHRGTLDDSSKYMWVKHVEAMASGDKVRYGEPRRGDGTDGGEEEVREYFSANSPF